MEGGIFMGVYGSPELHPNLINDDPKPTKKKITGPLKRVSFWVSMVLICSYVIYANNSLYSPLSIHISVCCLISLMCQVPSIVINFILHNDTTLNLKIIATSFVVLFVSLVLYMIA